MEQKRTLWIIAASGVFLLVVVGAALILYSPSLHKNQTQQAAFNPADGWTTPAYTTTTIGSDTPAPSTNDAFATNGIAVPDFNENVAPASPFDLPGNDVGTNAVAKNDTPPQSIQTENLTVYADNTTVYGTGTTTIDLNALKSSPSVAVTAQNETTAQQIASAQAAKAATSAQTYATDEPKANAVASTKPASSAKTTSAPAVASTKPATSAKPAAGASTKPAAPAKPSAAVAAAKVPDRFWVQAAAYATKKNADDARATLESNKIPSEVFTYTDAKGKVFYRVRIGPYTTSSEAEYWKTQVAKIDQFADAQSYVVNSSAKAVR